MASFNFGPSGVQGARQGLYVVFDEQKSQDQKSTNARDSGVSGRVWRVIGVVGNGRCW